MSSLLKSVVRRLRLSVRFDELRLEIDEELQFHLEMRIRDNLEAGMTPEAAEAEARRRFGDYQQIQQDCYTVGSRRLRRWGGMRTVVSLLLLLFGLALTFSSQSPMHTGFRLIFSMLAVLVTFLSLLSVRGSFRRRLIEPREPVLGLAEDADCAAAFHDERGRSPVERVLEDR
ncbi:MAG TPA: permease prefix domain 1-containing protein [Blastocatellia bacterium]|nr:permease prefix domain 1-containing protein [Blastocatellia bacterium]